MSDEAILAEVLARTPESVAVYDLDSTIRYLNPATERIFGVRLDDVRGRRLFELFPGAIGNLFHTVFERVAAAGGVELFDHYYAPFDSWFANRIERVGDRVHVLARDITDDVRRRRRLETVVRISQLLTTEDLDLSGAARATAEILNEVLDAECMVGLLSPDRMWVELVALASSNAHTVEVISQIKRWRAHVGHIGEALRTREAVLVHENAIVEKLRDVDDPILREGVERYAPTTMLVVPLAVGEDAIGVLTAARGRGSPPLTPDDRALVASIAPTVGLYLALARRRAEAASLRTRLVALADALPALVSFVDADERYQYVNAAYERWFESPREKLRGRRLDEAIGAEAYAAVAPYVRRALAGEAVRFRSKVPYPTGARDIDAQYVPIAGAGGKIDGFAVLVQDISAEMRVAELEREQRDAATRAAERLEMLLAVTGKLAGAERADEIARVLVDEGVDALDAATAGIWFVSGDGAELRLARHRAFAPEHATAFEGVSLTSSSPLVDAVKSGQPIWLRSRVEYAERYPELEAKHRPEPSPPLAFALLPLCIEGRSIGCMGFVFHEEGRLTVEERTYLELLASHGAEALRRARLYSELRDVSETREAMIKASPAAIMLLDAQGIVHAWNPAAERIFGWSAAGALGRFIPAAGDKKDELLANIQHVLAGNTIEGREAKRLRANGEWFDVELYAAPAMLSDGRAMCLSMVVDIAERKRIERGRQLVAEASAMFIRSFDWEKTLSDIVHHPLRSFADWCCVDIVEPGGTLYRVALSREEVGPGAPMPGRFAHDPGHGAPSLAIETRQTQVVRDIDDRTLERLACDEQHLQALRALRMRSLLSIPLIVGDRTLGALSMASRTRNFDDVDVTIASELTLRAATAIENARLFQEGSKARRDAEAANRAKDQFLAMLGHELRNPLAPIMTALELMRLRAPHQLERERAVVQRQVDHLSRLVDDLLDVSRITRGNVELRRERAQLAESVAKAIEMTSPLLEQRHHRLIVDVSPDLAVHGDKTRLSQIVANLLSNAAKYTESGGQIDIRASRSGANVVLSIRDTGIGIEREMLPHIFDVFVQAPQTIARTDGGLGLGLTIVRSLVELHGGTVSARSEGAGKGTEIIVTLPEGEAAAQPSESLRIAERRDRSTRRILVVDDNEDAAVMLGELLDSFGHEIRLASDGPSALRIADEFRPDVAILDIGLPVMDGYELAGRLRAKPELDGMRLIAVTGYGQESDRERALHAGFHEHCAKPVRIESLVRLVEGGH